ncbi:hypothetical protein EBE87_21895 [Pseudoroseomonas wenyumeiae]|uniref:Uncharacterized protein n=1 Tax=Teichococcus wenyumeiae TaxID=2478470 RepID=A0A3A9JMY2_9PROT|nr:hypothetical protein [Pseudoroseomonas wenyumeiae]RKK05196.1 hypothetical protein D6Z83_05470 [Pseudoroseomonas wenyumeiae]RMI17581.1 hypothetical protein EBE87_21895 [Pseudoroseomonas wenyumeiae]
MLLQRQELLGQFSDAPEVLAEEQLAARQVQEHGDLKTVGPVLRTSGAPPFWDKPTPPLGGGSPVWLPR